MDECLKDIVLQKYYHSEDPGDNLTNLYIIGRISLIAYTFSGEYFV